MKSLIRWKKLMWDKLSYLMMKNEENWNFFLLYCSNFNWNKKINKIEFWKNVKNIFQFWGNWVSKTWNISVTTNLIFISEEKEWIYIYIFEWSFWKFKRNHKIPLKKLLKVTNLEVKWIKSIIRDGNWFFKVFTNKKEDSFIELNL